MSYKINARHLVLDLMYASPHSTISIKRMLCAAQLLGISDNGIRVAVTRLCQENIIRAVERGVYQLVQKKFDSAFISLKKTPQMQFSECWEKGYLLAYSGHLGRVDRTALSKREKTFQYYGFKPIEQNLYVRPDNLGLTLSDLKQHMVKFGCEAELRLFKVSELDQGINIQALWDIKYLNQQYLATIQHIQNWFNALAKMNLQQAALSSFEVGKAGIFAMRSDPLLPSEWIDTHARQSCEEMVQKIEKEGILVWEKLFQQYGV